MSSPAPAPRRPRRDLRLAVGAAVVAGIVAGGYLLSELPGRGIRAATSTPFAQLTEAASPAPADRDEALPAPDDENTLPPQAKRALDAAARQLAAGQFDRAIAALNAAHAILKDEPRAFLLLGRALEGRQDYATARDFYTAALERAPFMPDAYWGVATTSEALGDLEAALGAMRSYLHVEPDKDPERLKIAQARSALWEWEARLGRGPWGPTKGIPPGFTADDIKRDGRGVAVRMQIDGSEQPDGRLLAEIRHADKQVIFTRP